MIDKSIEYRDIVMVMDGKTVMATAAPQLPEGFNFRLFEGENDISHWCRIEASVQEFDSENDAKKHFAHEFHPHLDEMKKRCIFITNKEGLPIATATCWFSDGEITSRLHWVAVCPGYQGLGLGKAVSQLAVNVSASIYPNQPMWLSTQTWSHRAVLMYHKLGFNIVKSDMKLGEKNAYVQDYPKAMEVLAGVLAPGDMETLSSIAI